MAYRDAEPPSRSKEEEELSKLAAAGRRVKQGRAQEEKRAQRALELRKQRAEVSERVSRLRALGRRSHPATGTLVIAGTISVFSVLGFYLLFMSSLHVAIWVHILFWGVCMPSIAPAVYLERAVAKRNGRRYEAGEKAWAGAQQFAIECEPWDRYDNEGVIRLQVHFDRRKPEPQLLADALGAVREDVEVEVVGLLGAEPEVKGERAAASIPPPGGGSEAESLTDMRAQAMLAASGGGLALAVRHRRGHHARYWLEGWGKAAVASAFETVHSAYPIERIRIGS